ncbi:response regulator [Bowmanella sp. JS7-9]|uniref:Response regulator n=1 Tax=Pseudobowmanella zhangzhouensis TaxID=1537679 RepID=A0ABW1XGX0_9ALTE|nr:response regulator [Bowmanella sp. JS7-9]TBX25760.1 chemotaxis protein CheC [Bowmanella sp. JS7-9]
MFSVLICDDSLVARKQVAKCLPDDWDVSIHFAKHGEDALEQIRAGKGQLLLLDLNMPVLDGYETLKHIQEEALPTRTIVISGDIQPKAHNRVLELGALDFIQKPVNAETLQSLLSKFDIYTKTDEPKKQLDGLDPQIRDCYQEISNIAMGQAGDHLARMLNVFVELPIPNVNLIEVSELHMMLTDIEEKESVSGICQGFVGPGVSGEALFILSDSGVGELAQILGIEGDIDDKTQLEVMMDAANILIGTCLNGLAEQLDMHFSQGHPVILGQHYNIRDLINTNKARWRRTLAIELSYGLEGFSVHCDLLLFITEESMKIMNAKLAHFMEDLA